MRRDCSCEPWQISRALNYILGSQIDQGGSPRVQQSLTLPNPKYEKATTFVYMIYNERPSRSYTFQERNFRFFIPGVKTCNPMWNDCGLR